MKDAQVGFNTNVAYRGMTLHIQTEDSGLGRPHVVTHLYWGGTILATRRTSYDPSGDAALVRQRVRELMKSQHKQLIMDLRNGLFDEKIDRLLTNVELPAAQAEREPARTSAPTPAVPGGPVASPAAAAREAAPVASAPVLEACREPLASPPAAAPAPSEEKAAGWTVPAARPRPSTPWQLLARRQQEGFGKDLISGRSLDDVVISYLVEELAKEEK